MKKDTSLKSRIEKLHITLKIGIILFLFGLITFYSIWGLKALGVISENNFALIQTPPFFKSSIILITIGIVLTILKRKEPQKKELPKPNKMKWEIVILIIFVGILGAAFVSWVGEYVNRGGFLGITSIPSIFVPFLGPLILTLILNEQPWKIALLITAGVIIAFMFGIFYSEDAGTIWPLWLGIVITFTLPSAFIGSYLAQLIKYIKSNSIASVKK